MISTENYSEKIEKLKEALNAAGCIVIGAGAGLSASAGFTYSGERFKKNFAGFEEKYGFHDMYSGGFNRYDCDEEFWAFWSRNIMLNRYSEAPKPVYDRLFGLVKNKDYFVITTNVDHCFRKAGFDKKRLFYTQGDYGLFQCSEPCSTVTYDNEELVRRMFNEQKDLRIPTELIPKCPKCGRPMTLNLRCDDTFVEDEGWHRAAVRYRNFLRTRQNQKLLFLELGVGNNTPGIIKYPFWQMTAEYPSAVYVCLNLSGSGCPSEIEDRSVCIDGDIGEILDKIPQ